MLFTSFQNQITPVRGWLKKAGHIALCLKAFQTVSQDAAVEGSVTPGGRGAAC
jgi:hypothetical protein